MSDQPIEPPAEAGAEPPQAPEEESSPALSPHEVTDYLTGHQPDEEELLYRQHEAALDALEDGRAVEQIAAGQQSATADIELLRQRNPGIGSPEAVEAMSPLFDELVAAYGPEAAALPEVLEQIYEKVGGPERFAPHPGEERWTSVVSTLQGKDPDAFSR